jgi:hypothetical protein
VCPLHLANLDDVHPIAASQVVVVVATLIILVLWVAFGCWKKLYVQQQSFCMRCVSVLVWLLDSCCCLLPASLQPGTVQTGGACTHVNQVVPWTACIYIDIVFTIR